MIAIRTRKANMVCNENLRTGNTLVGEGGQLPGKLVRSKSRE